MKDFKSHFKFNKRERRGIFFLLSIICILQIAYVLFLQCSESSTHTIFLEDTQIQVQIDSLRTKAIKRDSVPIYPFNPNFITDYKGYALGMSVAEIDRLHEFRERNKYVNSPLEFQKVTLVSDSLLNAISPYFKFPEWTQRSVKDGNTDTRGIGYKKDTLHSNRKAALNDLNTVSVKDLKSFYGIGDVLSERIIKFRDRLGGFLSEDQLYDVYGLEEQIANRVLSEYRVIEKPIIKKININVASAREISQLVYLGKRISQEIVLYRNTRGRINSFDELLNIPGFPSDKIDRIILYLSL